MADNQGLKRRKRQFAVTGKVKLPSEGIATPETNAAGTWLGVRTGFNVETSEGNSIYVALNGGRALKLGYIMALPKEIGQEMKRIPFDQRNDEEVLRGVSDMSFYRVRLGEESYRTIDYLDYVAYLKDHLKNGMEVVVRGNVEYFESERNGETNVYRNYVVNNIYTNEERDDTDNGLRYDRGATITQTYIFTDSSVSSRFEKELKEDGQTVISVFAPEYFGKMKNSAGQYVEYKHTVPVAQSFIVKADKDDEKALERTAKIIKALFKLKRDKVVERDIEVEILEGYQKVENDFELSPEMKELIKEGIITEDSFKEAPTISSTRVSELVFKNIVLIKNEEEGVQVAGLEHLTMDDLIRPLVDDEEEDQFDVEADFEEKEEDSDSIFGDGTLDDIFKDGDDDFSFE